MLEGEAEVAFTPHGPGHVMVGVRINHVNWFKGSVALARFTDAALPYADATIAGASVVAQVLLAMRRVENWALWIAINVLSIGVYINRELYLTAGLYVAFLVLATAGLIAVDPQLFGWSMWATIHGIVMLHQAGMLQGGPDYATLNHFHGALMFKGAVAAAPQSKNKAGKKR